MGQAASAGSEPPLRLPTKVIAYIATWLLALIATNPSASLVSLVWMFPLGLLVFLYPPAFHEGGWGVLLASFGVYVLHAVLFFRSRAKLSTYVCYGVLVVILLCNVAGCRSIINSR